MNDDELDALLDEDAPEPSRGFDEAFWRRFEEADSAGVVEALLDSDRPEPSAGFDERVRTRLAGERNVVELFPAVRPGRLRRRGRWIGATVGAVAAAAMAAAMLLTVTPPEAPDEVPPSNLAMMANLELLEDLETLQVLDGVADEETFELVAMLDELEAEEGLP